VRATGLAAGLERELTRDLDAAGPQGTSAAVCVTVSEVTSPDRTSADALPRVTLRDEAAELEAKFVAGANMLCCSLRHRGVELLAQNAGVEAYVGRGKTMGIPLLYPWANRLAGFRYAAAGSEVQVPHDTTRVALDGNGLPIHGLVGGRLRWELEPRGADVPGTASGHSVKAGAFGSSGGVAPGMAGDTLAARLRFDESLPPELFAVFPFRHEVRYRTRLGGGELEIEIEVHAVDRTPVAFGFHPYLLPPGEPRERWRVTLPAMRRLELDARQIPTGVERALPEQAFALDGRAYDDGFALLGQPTRFAVAGGGRNLAIELREGYRYAQVYAPLDRACICFEPMTAPADALCSGAGLTVLAPGESHRARFALVVSA